MNRIAACAGELVERININRTWREVRDGRIFWCKQRRRNAAPVIACANLFFRAAGATIRVMRNTADWQQWEVKSFRDLHGDSFQSFFEQPGIVGAEELPGVNLTKSLDRGSMTPAMAAAAGREMRRAHAQNGSSNIGGWSHGDPHAGNFIYDEAAERARLIDFEVQHVAVAAHERHSDDVLAFLLDLAGRIAAERWLACGRAFLDGYARPEIEREVSSRLIVPGGRSWPWFAVRTGFLSAAQARLRFDALRETMAT